MPARASTSPFAGSSAAMPPKRPARPTTAASWMRVSIVVRTGSARAGAGRGRGRAGRRAARRRGGRAAGPRTPPRGRSGPPASRGGSPARTALPALRAVSSGSMLPAIESAIPVSGEVRSPAGPRASTLRFRDRSVARSGGTLSRVRRSPSRSSGNTRRGRQSTRSPVTGTSSSPCSAAEHLRLDDERDHHLAVALAVGAVGFDARLGGRVGRPAVEGPEALEGPLLLSRVAEQRVHVAQVTALPRGGEVSRRAFGARGGAATRERPGHERHAARARPRRVGRDGSGACVARR